MAEAAEIASKGDSKDRKNFVCVLGNFFKFPFQKDEPKLDEITPRTEENEGTSERPDVVRFLYKPLEDPPPSKLELEEESGRTSNPLVLWQVYALGGFLILKWVWGRWKERKDSKGDNEASDNYRSPADDSSSFH